LSLEDCPTSGLATTRSQLVAPRQISLPSLRNALATRQGHLRRDNAVIDRLGCYRMRGQILHSFAEILWFSILSGLAFAQLQEPPKLSYDVLPDFFQLPPGEHLIEPAGVALNSKGHTYVFHRGKHALSHRWAACVRGCRYPIRHSIRRARQSRPNKANFQASVEISRPFVRR
jgi:hypothetical protein